MGASGLMKGAPRRTKLALQPALGDDPIALGCGHGDPERARRLLDRQAHEIAQFDEAGLASTECGESLEGLVNREQLIVPVGRGRMAIVERHLHSARPFSGGASPSVVGEDASHGERRHAHEMRTTVEGRVLSHESQVRFVDECRGLQRVIGMLPPQLRDREHPQLIVQQREELVEGARSSSTQFSEQARDCNRSR